MPDPMIGSYEDPPRAEPAAMVGPTKPMDERLVFGDACLGAATVDRAGGASSGGSC